MKHVIFGGSSASRWLNCPGSTELTKQMPAKPVGRAALEGSAQHAVMEMLLRDPGLSPEEFLGATVLGIEIRADHVDAIRLALDAYESIIAQFPETALLFAENFVFLSDDVGGTLDAAVVHKDRAAIIDFKFGMQPVPADSPQNLFYATCARRSHEAFKTVKNVDCYIVQPALDEPVNSVSYTERDLDAFEITVRAATELKHDVFVEGSWCRWCPAKLACPPKTSRLATLTAPEHVLDLNELGAQLLKLRAWDNWRQEAEARIEHELMHGATIKGWKLVAKRALREWTSEEAARKALDEAGVPRSSYITETLVTPAKAEKLLGKKKVAELAISKSSGTTAVPEHDKREAVLPIMAAQVALAKL